MEMIPHCALPIRVCLRFASRLRTFLFLSDRLMRIWRRSQARLHHLLKLRIFRWIGFSHEEIDAATAKDGTTMIDEAQSMPEGDEAFSPKVTFTWINPNPIEAGERIVPARIASRAGRKFAALCMILTDLSFALECLTEADRLGIPHAINLHIKTLIFSWVVAYARPFIGGVRAIKLTTDIFSEEATFNIDIHEYLIALRNKHISHSINEFESCEAIAMIIGTPELGWRDGGAIGAAETQSIGLTRTMVRQAIAHITGAINFLSTIIEKRRVELYNEFKIQFAKDGKWEMAPFRVPHFSNVSKARPMPLR